MAGSKKGFFIKALVLTILVFGAGILVGYGLENWRTRWVESRIDLWSIGWIDYELQKDFFNLIEKESCDVAIRKNLEFADRTYEEVGLRIEKFENANEITNDILMEQRMYILLKVEFWLNSILLKEKCGSPYHNVVYFYEHTPGIEKKAQQDVISKKLLDLKENYGERMMLIPIDVSLNLSVVDTLRETYGVDSTPIILVDEKNKFSIDGLDDIENFLKNGGLNEA